VTTAFGPADHVTEREVGPWRDCTFASMLETLRLGLPNGRQIPATIEEKERFRAAAGFPDNHTGATIEDTLPAARSLYGLRDDQFRLTRDWATVQVSLATPGRVLVVTGSMAHVPAHLRRYSPSFMGAHAVAARGGFIWCDPLAPKDGTYQGEVVSAEIWRDFFDGLGPGHQALIMDATGGQGMIAMGGVKVRSDKLAKVIRLTDLLDAPGGKRIAGAKAGYTYPYLGADSGYRVVIVNTAIPYPDKVIRPTGLYIRAADVDIIDAPEEPEDSIVTVQIDGQEVFRTTA
jgi:hypothetical protein